MINVGANKNKSSLKDLIQSNKVIPISVFFKTTRKQAIKDAIDYLKDKGYGSVFVPPEGSVANNLVISIRKNKQDLLDINFSTLNYRYPINTETRPYTNDPWVVGDIIYNTDILENKCYGWICVSSGTPGVWEQIGTIQPFNTYVELVESLPKASIPQLGRQLRYKLNNKECLFMCKEEDGIPKWIQQDYIIGTTAHRPINAPNGTWYYNTDVDRYEWYSEKANKWFRFEQMEGEFSKWEKSVEDELKKWKKSIEEELDKWNKTKEEWLDEFDNLLDRIENESNILLDKIKDDYEKNNLSSLIIWKSPVNSLSDLNNMYPNPDIGWTVRVEDESTCYRYDGINWMVIGDAISGDRLSIGENGNWYINGKDSGVAADIRKVNKSIYNTAIGLINKKTEFNSDGSITEKTDDGILVTKFNSDGSIVETFTFKSGEVINKTTTFDNNIIYEEVD